MKKKLYLVNECMDAIITILACIISVTSDVLYIKVLSALITVLNVVKIFIDKGGKNHG